MALSRDQESLLELLVKVKDFMDENGITFYLFGGSCIGALRHRGFIPWDDDIDIILDRENYEKLIKASYNMSRDDMEFWCFEKSDDYFKPFGQFSSKKDTYFLKSRVFNRGLCMGTIIDVFVLDYVPSAELEQHKHDLLLYEDVLGFYRLHRDEISDIKDEYFALVERERKEGRRKVIEELQAKVERHNKEESDLLVTRFWVRKLRKYRKEWFGEPRYVEFEGYMMPIPAQAEATLRLQYGYDWYRLPVEENQEIHNFYVNHDLSNNNYVEDMEKFIDTDNIVELLEGRKHHQVDRLNSQLVMRDIGGQLLYQRLTLELRDVIKNKDYAGFEPIFKNLKTFKVYGAKGSVMPEDTLVGWMMWLIKAGRYYDAIKVADCFVEGSHFTSALEDEFTTTDISEADFTTVRGVLALLNQLILLGVSYQDNQLDELTAILSTIPVELQDEIADCLLAKTKLALKEADTAAMEIVLSECDKYLLAYPDNYEVLKAKADLLHALSRDADKLYDCVRKNSRNGLDILELRN